MKSFCSFIIWTWWWLQQQSRQQDVKDVSSCQGMKSFISLNLSLTCCHHNLGQECGGEKQKGWLHNLFLGLWLYPLSADAVEEDQELQRLQPLPQDSLTQPDVGQAGSGPWSVVILTDQECSESWRWGTQQYPYTQDQHWWHRLKWLFPTATL